MQSPVPDFLQAFRSRDHRKLERFLHSDVVYHVGGLEPVVGRRDVLAYWRRMFESYEAVHMSLERHVRDGGVVLTAQRQVYRKARRGLTMLDSMVIYQLCSDRIRLWCDGLSLADLDETDVALWRRLRAARW